ncbi:YqiA/YcfP family alpha/beta fold hydrolase [uncultured Christiangramia sp.]|uniref:YqiA/YcfP family alpha/beta fold hydrolase n=1 Tax=uncultured Christiangramia sp. TaxID=503836 RepID=UPI002628E44A|nr:YqiA/YcfP family alpha/beta fold hydrolase [uncultured Christiangramia sp.]
MNILYLHGLKSKLSKEKRKILEQYGNVYAPDINYNHQHIQPVEILKHYLDTEFNVVIGSSMGGLNAYIISENIGRPALIFNPPLSNYRLTNFKSFYLKGLACKQILLGGNDDVVDPLETMTFLGKHLTTSELNINTDPMLGHRIPVSVFKKQLDTFFSKICH